MSLAKILSLISTAQAAFQAAMEIAGEFSSTLSTDDQAELKAALAKMADANDAGHERLQAKLAAAAEQ